MINQIKMCSKCAEGKSLEEFPFDKRRSDGRMGVCRSCRKAREEERAADAERKRQELEEQQERERREAHERKVAQALEMEIQRRVAAEIKRIRSQPVPSDQRARVRAFERLADLYPVDFARLLKNETERFSRLRRMKDWGVH